jgi:hypothetical protein
LGEKGVLRQKFVEEHVNKVGEKVVIQTNLNRKESLLSLLK